MVGQAIVNVSGSARVLNERLHPEDVKMLLDYDPRSGWLKWRHRQDSNPSFNARFAGKRAGGLGSRGYWTVSLYGQLYLGHRLAWAVSFGEWPSLDIDHINGNRTDNRIVNLRLATRSENGFNQPAQRRNRSGMKGVYPDGDRWRAKLMAGGRTFRLGSFRTIAEAGQAYAEAAKTHQGAYAHVETAVKNG